MVERVESSGLDEFEGIVEKVELETGIQDRQQYHLTIEATSVKIGGATGKLHEWIPMSPKAEEAKIPQGSVMDRFLQQVEICVPAAKKSETVSEALALLQGGKFKFKRIKLGKDYDGHKAREYIVPVMPIK